MRPLNPIELDRDMWARIEASSRRTARIQTQITSRYASNLTRWANYGGASLAPGVLSALAQAGVEPESETGRRIIREVPEATDNTQARKNERRMSSREIFEFREEGGTITLEDGSTREVEARRRSGVKIPGASLLSGATGLIGDAAGGLAAGVGALSDVLAAPREALQSDAQNRLDDQSQQAAQSAVASTAGAVLDPVYEGTKTGVRNLTTGLEAPIELIQTGYARGEAIRSGAAEHYGLPQPLTSSGYEQPVDLYGNPFESTTLYQQIRGKDAGSGWFAIGPGTEAGRAQARAARRQRGTVDGEAATVGRLFASTVVEPGSTEYSIMSGLVDAAVVIKGDPSVVALNLVGDAAKARKIVLTDEAGMVAGHRRWLEPRRASQFLDSAPMRDTIDKLATTTGFREIDQLTNRKLPVDTILDLADAENPAQVRGILHDVLGIQVRDVPRVAKPAYTWKRSIRDVRMMQLLPEGSGIHFNDLDNGVRQFERLLVTGRVPDREVSRLMDLAARSGRAENPRDFLFDVVVREGSQALTTSIKRQIGDDPSKTEFINKAITFFKDRTEESRKFFIDATGDAGRIDDVTLGGEIRTVGPHLPLELLDNVIPFPDVRELKRLTSVWAPVWANPATRPLIENSVMFFDWFNTRVFKFLALARPAYPLRVQGENQLRMAGAGLDSAFNHPASWIATVAGGAPDGKLAKLIKKFGVEPKDDLDRMGRQFGADDLAEELGIIDPYRGTLSKRGDAMFRGEGFASASPAGTQFGSVSVATGHGLTGWAKELSILAHDPIGRRVAKALNGTADDAVERGIRFDTPEGELFHGTSRAFPDDKFASDAFMWGDGSNLYGPGFYVTDTPDVARSYVKKGRGSDPVVYGTRPKADARWLDENDPVPDEMIARINNEILGVDDVVRPGMSVADVNNAVKRFFREEGFERYAADELRESINEMYAGAGYSGIRYAGGKRVKGAKPHTAYVVFSPEDTLDMAGAARPREVNPIEAIKESYRSGPLQKYRQRHADANTWGGVSSRLATDDALADSYIDSVVTRLQTVTGGQDDLIRAVADQAFDGKALIDLRNLRKKNTALRARLAQYAKDGVGPKIVNSAEPVAAGGLGPSAQMGAKLDRMIDGMFDILASRPENFLAKSPAYRQFYKTRSGEMQGLIDAGTLTTKQADLISHLWAAEQTKKLLYDVSRRGNFFDTFRHVFPFGEAWKEVTTSWIRITAENPKVIRRAQQAVQGARGSGFFYTGEDGREYFNLPLTGKIAESTIGVPFPQRASVSGLSLMTSVGPGVGPIAQIPLSQAIPKTESWASVREAISPYGDPDTDSGLFEAFFPGWAQKFRSAGVFEPLVGPSETQERSFWTLWGDVMTYNASTGVYDTSNEEDLHRMAQDSKAQAEKLMIMRGFAQSVSPSAPQTVPLVKAKDGRMYEIYRLARDYYELLDEDPETATAKFIDSYGEAAFLVMQPGSKTLVPGLAPSDDFEYWREANKEFAGAFPLVYAFFGPTDSEFDNQASLAQYDRGERQMLTPREWQRRGNHRVANMKYAQARAQVGPNPTPEQDAWLRDVRAALREDYPGFRDASILPTYADIDTSIVELRDAVAHPSVKDTEMATAVKKYLSARDMALEQAVGGSLGGQDDAHLRGWLRDIGGALTQETPEFLTMWDYLFRNEIEEADDQVEDAA